MRLRRGWTCVILLWSTPSIAVPATVEEIARLLGGKVCYGRSYDAAHLARRPGQKLETIEIGGATRTADGMVRLQLAARFENQGGRRFAETATCSASTPDGPARCIAACGGGGQPFTLQRTSEGDLLIRGYVRFADPACDDPPALAGRRLTGISDDLKILRRLPACSAVKP